MVQISANHHTLLLQRKTSVAQQDSDQFMAKLVLYVLRVRSLWMKYEYELAHIIAIDETHVRSDMVSSTTIERKGVKTITIKSTGHEKCGVTVCLSAKADDTKMKLFIISKGQGERFMNW